MTQNFFLSFYAGAANYSGDLQEKSFTMQQAHPSAGVGFLFELNEKMLIKGDFIYGRVSAEDKYSTKNKARNLSFYSNISEFSIGFEYNLLNLYEYPITPFIFTGIALFDFNPYTKTANGNIIFLPEMSTEGQGFLPGVKDYKLRQYSIPVGGGLQWAISNNKRIALIAGFRKTFTDYLDDVSTNYVDETLLAMNRGQKAVDIAFRGDDINSSALYPAGGAQRGSPKSKDIYYFTGISLRIRLVPKGRIRKFRLINYNTTKSRKERMGCPVVF